MKKFCISLLLVLVALPLAACDPDEASVKTICKALIGPIKYNSTKPESFRFAGKTLVLDLKQRNQVWLGLNCPSVVKQPS